MPLPAYGLLIGRVTSSRPQSGGHPHWLLMVEPALKNHPAYRVAVNLESTDPAAPPEVEYQIIDVATQGRPGLKALVDTLRTMAQPASFVSGPGVPSLDFVRGDLLDVNAFLTVPQDSNPLKDAFQAALDEAMTAGESDGKRIAVFGTGYPVNTQTRRSPSTGYTGVDNIHMNQGSPNRVGQASYYRENGANQDGGLILFDDTSATAFFVKFQSQSTNTDGDGNPVAAGSAPIDTHLDQAMAAVRAAPAVTAALQAKLLPDPAARPKYVFADPDPNDATETYVPDVDTWSKTPFVTGLAQGQVRGPVPAPRGDTVSLKLTDIVGANVPGYSNLRGVETLQFDVIGDSGAVTASKLQGEKAVGELLTQMAQSDQPAFLYHVGDVVYYYGEKKYYYGQFADVFKDYPAPIFAIPGNHDGLTYDASMVSLDSFMNAFCAAEPGPWDGFGGVQRSAMTQPGVYFTLDAPLVSIIGLYSNCGESGGWLNDHQYAFLLSELKRLAPLRANKDRAVILAIHHLPRWFPGHTDATSAAIDAVCAQAGLWPDAVLAGHAHLYERIVRPKGTGGAPMDIPYFIDGGGGYNIVPTQKTGGAYLGTLPEGYTTTLFEEGFLRTAVTKTADAMTLKFTYFSAKRPTAGAVDSYTVTL